MRRNAILAVAPTDGTRISDAPTANPLPRQATSANGVAGVLWTDCFGVRSSFLIFSIASAAVCLSACSPSETASSPESAAVPVIAEAPVEAADASGEAPVLSISGGGVSAAGGADSMMMATVGVITRLRDADTVKALAAEAFRAADADNDGALGQSEFGAALEYVARRGAIGEAIGAVAGAAGEGSGRGAAFDAAGRRSGAVTQDQFVAYFDMKRVEADRDYDGKLDDAEYASFAALINGATPGN